ncbi:transposase [Streptomyces sp. NPDC015220]|uniref:transposase n=1 Tax=Streptomyces sp. NPDC015220 TaxID=3364947 RepID=UPI0037015A1D
MRPATCTNLTTPIGPRRSHRRTAGHRDRCRAAEIPDERGFAPKGELARDLVRRRLTAGLPAKWVTADNAYGQDWNFCHLLEQLDIVYVVAMPESKQMQVPDTELPRLAQSVLQQRDFFFPVRPPLRHQLEDLLRRLLR